MSAPSSSSSSSPLPSPYSPFIPSSSSSPSFSLPFQSRRSSFLATRHACSSSQPLATAIGVRILDNGGNAADACVAMAAALALLEPASTGIGGDCFALFYNATDKKVYGLNGSGRSPKALSLDNLPKNEIKIINKDNNNNNNNSSSSSSSIYEWCSDESIHCVTVPGAAAGWVDCHQQWGSGNLSMIQLLEPVIDLAENGAPISKVSAWGWGKGVRQLKGSREELLMEGGVAPKEGDRWKNPHLAKVFRLVAEKGKAGFYEGEVTESIIKLMEKEGGMMTADDLKSHSSEFVEPISTDYDGVNIYEIPPNGQGLTVLLALNLLKEIEKKYGSMETTAPHLSALYYHRLIEALRLAFADTRYFIADSNFSSTPIKELLSENYAKQRIEQYYHENKATVDVKKGSPIQSSNTVSFVAVDRWGNACSFINSNYKGFGSGYIPNHCGFTLQNRGANFSLDPSHPNKLEGGKRPYHTIIPGLATNKDGSLWGPFSVMGAFMQPQGHVQLLINIIKYKLSPQLSLDVPRFCIECNHGNKEGVIFIEQGVDTRVVSELQSMGHRIELVSTPAERMVFGRGQVIKKAENGILWCGSDGRADGCAMGF